MVGFFTVTGRSVIGGFKISRSVVSYFLGKWLVDGGAKSVVGDRWPVIGGWSVVGGFVLRPVLRVIDPS